MGIEIRSIADGQILEGMPGVRILHVQEDAARLIEGSFEHQTWRLLLYAENLTEHFFDLSSGEAGAILQKLRNYHIKLAVVLSPGDATLSAHFREMALEEGKGGDFRLFEDRDLAEAWLLNT